MILPPLAPVSARSVDDTFIDDPLIPCAACVTWTRHRYVGELPVSGQSGALGYNQMYRCGCGRSRVYGVLAKKRGKAVAS